MTGDPPFPYFPNGTAFTYAPELPPAPVVVKVKKLHPDAVMPTKGTPGSAGWDLYATEDVTLYAMQVKAVPVGLAMEIPEGHEIQVRPRSGLAAKHGVMVVNSPGTVDSDYRGEFKVLMTVISSSVYVIKKGDRIAQMVVNKLPDVVLGIAEELSDTERGPGGFGSTGA